MRKQGDQNDMIYERRELKLWGFVLFSWIGRKLSTRALLRRLPGVEL